MKTPRPDELRVRTLGPCSHPSPLCERKHLSFVEDGDRVLAFHDLATLDGLAGEEEGYPTFEMAGPRRDIFFDPGTTGCGIVTCGGLCPGLNDVIRSVVRNLWYAYGVRRIKGYRFGYAGLAADTPHEPIDLTPEVVDRIHERGGTFLGSSRGPQDIGEMIETMRGHGVGILFCIGGDGTLRGAAAIAEEVTRRNLAISVIGIPKTIDNDLAWITRTFGFATAVEAARETITAAHNEAIGAWNGVGVVKLMGRHSGFIAANACLASADVNYCLIPEVPFVLEGEGGFLEVLEERISRVHHAVVVVAEGCGQEYFEDQGERARDASGNIKLNDVGVLVRDRIREHLTDRKIEHTVKYIDPSYTIRSLSANAFDSELSLVLGQYAVHAGMAGRTSMLVGSWNQRFTHVPISLSVGRRKQVQPRGELWQRVLDATGQPSCMFREGEAIHDS